MNAFALTEMVDRVFADRYRVEALVGAGPISAVYAAHDRIEGRRVALKVFDEGLAEDAVFAVRLFEAVERAAGLAHQNIVDIYDWGVDGAPFIVSELCEGGSLASMLARGGVIDPSQALVVALESARALNHGHEQGVLHRGLNPHNVLFSGDHRVRIGDFGLAPVLSEVSVSQSSRALENVRYSSPEQARGRPITEATDLYSLALVVNEAVTGRSPEVAETVVGTLMARAESAVDLDPTLQGLLPSIERCGRVDAAERPEADELTIALLAAAETMPRPGALPLQGLESALISDRNLRVAGGRAIAPDPSDLDGGEFGDSESESATSALGDGNVLALGDGPLGDGALVDGPLGDGALGAGALDDGEIDHSNVLALVDGSDVSEPDDEFDISARGGLDDLASKDLASNDLDDEFGISARGGLDDLASDDLDDEFDISALGELDDLDDFGDDSDRGNDFGDGFGSDDIVLSGVALESPASALDKLESVEPVFATAPVGSQDHDFDIPSRAPVGAARSTYEEMDDDADDRLPWWPLALLVGLVAAAIVAAFLLLGVGQSDVAGTAPSVTGLTLEELPGVVDSDVQVEVLERREDGSVPGAILAQSPAAGDELGADQTLTVTVSLGNQMVELPSDIIGLTLEQAASRLTVVGLSVGELTEENNEALAAGLVVGLNEPTTQKPAGQSVALRISVGPTDRVVPNEIVGQSIADATSLLVGLRLQAVEELAYSPDIAAGTVLAAIPVPGEVVPADSAVTLIVSAGPEPVQMPDIVGLTLGEARDAIEALGLVFLDSEGTPGEPVIGSLPPIGATADVGTEVTIILADPVEEEEDEG